MAKEHKRTDGKKPLDDEDEEITHRPPPRATKTLGVMRLSDGQWTPVERRPVRREEQDGSGRPGWPAAWERPAERGAFGRYSAESRHGARYASGGEASRPDLEAFYQASKARREKQRSIEQVQELLLSIPAIRSSLEGRARPRPGQKKPDPLASAGVMLLEVVRALVGGLMGSRRVGRGRTGARVGGEKERRAFGSAVAVLETSQERPLIGVGEHSLEVAQDRMRTTALWHHRPNGGPEMHCKQSHSGASHARGLAAVERVATAHRAISRAGVGGIDFQGLIAWRVEKLSKEQRLLRFRVNLLEEQGLTEWDVEQMFERTAPPLEAQLHALRRELADLSGVNAFAVRPEPTLREAGVVEEDRRRREEFSRNTSSIVTTSGSPVADPEIRPTLPERSVREIVREMMGNPHHWAWPDRFSHEDRLLIAEARRGGKPKPIHPEKRLSAIRKSIAELEIAVDRAEREDKRALEAAIRKATEDMTDSAILARLRRAYRSLEESLLAPPEHGAPGTTGLIPMPERMVREREAPPPPEPIRPRRMGDLWA